MSRTITSEAQAGDTLRRKHLRLKAAVCRAEAACAKNNKGFLRIVVFRVKNDLSNFELAHPEFAGAQKECE